MIKNLSANAGDMDLIPSLGRSKNKKEKKLGENFESLSQFIPYPRYGLLSSKKKKKKKVAISFYMGTKL